MWTAQHTGCAPATCMCVHHWVHARSAPTAEGHPVGTADKYVQLPTVMGPTKRKERRVPGRAGGLFKYECGGRKGSWRSWRSGARRAGGWWDRGGGCGPRPLASE